MSKTYYSHFHSYNDEFSAYFAGSLTVQTDVAVQFYICVVLVANAFAILEVKYQQYSYVYLC